MKYDRIREPSGMHEGEGGKQWSGMPVKWGDGGDLILCIYIIFLSGPDNLCYSSFLMLHRIYCIWYINRGCHIWVYGIFPMVLPM